MGHILHFSVEGIRGAVPLDETMYLVRMVRIDDSGNKSYGVAGYLNLHGTLIPVYSLRKLFGFADRPPRTTDNLIITRVGDSDVALWVDETFVVREDYLPVDDDSGKEPVIPGVSVLPDGLVVLRDVGRFLAYQREKGSDTVSGIAKGLHDIMMTDLNISIDHHGRADYDRDMAILEERALELAQPEEVTREISSIDVLTFQLLYLEYAVELRYVRESVLSREITPVPGAPEHILGVLPLRGEIIPLIDLRVLLSIPEKGLTDLNQVIVLTDGVLTFGILSDQITGIISLPRNSIRPPDSTVSAKNPGYILGFSSDSLIVINAQEILSDPAMIVDDSREQALCPTSSSSCREPDIRPA